MKRFLARHSPLVLLALLCIVVAVISPEFRAPRNLQSVALRTAVVGIIAAGQTLVIITGGIDLAVGSVAALSGIVACICMTTQGMSPSVGIVVGSMVGLVCGGISGFFSTYGRIQPFIATLGMMMAARGAAMLLSGGNSVSGMPRSFDYLGGGKGWWIPVVILVIVVASFTVLLTMTRFGRALYASGGNLQAARLSGVRINAVRLGAFMLCGLLTGFAGVMLASRTSIASPTAAEGMELDAIAACVIGGASLSGGEGGCIGALAGALIMNVLVNFCNLRNLDPSWQKVLVGGLLIALIYYDTRRKRKAGLLKD